MIENMPPWLLLLIYGLAVARFTVLLALDEIFRPLRERLVHALLTRDKPWHRKAAYLVGGASDDADGCPWCLSVWAAGPAAVIVYYAPTHPATLIPAVLLAFSQLTGMIAAIGRG